MVSQPLIVQDKISDRIRQLVALPATLQPTGTLTLVNGRSRARSLDRVSGCTKLVGSDMSDHGRLGRENLLLSAGPNFD